MSQERVDRELAVLAARLTSRYGSGAQPFGYRLRPIVFGGRELDPIHLAMSGAALAVLLIACANLASLMLARGVVKRRELALRLALGARRAALIRQLFAESALLSAAGGVVGVLLSVWAIDLLAHNMLRDDWYLGLAVPHPTWRVFAFAFLATAGTSLLAGLLPALRTSDVEVAEPLKDNTGTTTGKVRWRYSPLVIGEVALGLVLLMGVALLTKAVTRVSGFDFGFPTAGLLSGGISYRRNPGADATRAEMHRVLGRIGSIEGVQAAAAYFGVVPDDFLVISDAYNQAAGFLNSSGVLVVSPAFLRTLGIPVSRGRDFLEGDGAGGAAIVDEDAARLLWGGSGNEAVGRTVKLGDLESEVPWIRVVGVARRARLSFAFDPYYKPEPQVYVVSDRYAERATRGFALAARVVGGEALMALRIQRQLQAASPPGVTAYLGRWVERFETRLEARKYLVGVFGLFSVFALALASVGLYGVLAYTVGQRVREFAVRIALGAEPVRVLRLVLHDGAVMLLAGTAIGAFLAMWGARVLDDWLYDVFFTDAASLVVAEVVLLLTGFAACLGPALRATRANPVEILRAS